MLPISYADAQVFLQTLGGRAVPPGWRGALPITYHVGPSTVQTHLAVKSDWSQKPIYDVIAMMKGSTYPDQWVVRGNHHDGWVFGASDPLSGQVALLAEAKTIGAMVKQGWRPLAHHRLYELGRRRADARRLDGVGRDARERTEEGRSSLYQL